MIVRHDRLDRETLVDPAAWPSITSFFNGSGAATLIAPTWLLTAAHVARQIPTDAGIGVMLGGGRYPLARVLLHPGYVHLWEYQLEDDETDTIDLALVELATPVAGIEPLGLYERQDEVGREVLLVGSGNGRRGMLRGSDRQLRRVTNVIDGADKYWLTFRFDEPPAGTYLEGVAGAGDSGGPALIESDGRRLIAGVSSWQKTGGRPMGAYGCVEHYARVSRYAAWIRETIDPARG
jgi:hypothetical protein